MPVNEQAGKSEGSYLSELACATGRLFGNLLSLELLLRAVLYEAKYGQHEPLPEERELLSVAVGEQLPINSLTSWDSLGQLIEKYNSLEQARDRRVDTNLKTLRDMFAHGRILADQSAPELTLIRFSKPRNGVVVVEGVQTLSTEWVSSQVALVRKALDAVNTTLASFPTQRSVPGVS